MDYVYLRAWDRMMQSGPSWCAEQLRKARATKAPDDAIYWKHNGGWEVYANVTSSDTRRVIDRIVAQMKERAQSSP